MIYWPKLLITAYAITNTLEPFIPLYLINQLQLNALQVSIVVAIICFLRLFSGIYTAVVDTRPHLYGSVIAILVTFSSVSFMMLLSLSNPFVFNKINDSWIWTLVILCTILNGLFYQPLGSLIDSAIIKTLGDFRVLFYGAYVRWSKSTTIIMTALIGWLVSIAAATNNDDSSLEVILLSTWVVGMVLLLLIALLFTTVEPANASQLNISDEQAPLLLKNALHLTADQNSNLFPSYRPYSIFGEQLSHISEEEDSSQLDRMFTNETSLRHVDSFDSGTPSYYSYSQQYATFDEENNNQMSSMTLIPTVPANALALLPLPTPTDPLVAFFPWMRPDQDNLQDDLMAGGPYYYQYNQNNALLSKVNSWKTNTLSLTLFILGVSYTLLNTFLFIYVNTMLEVSLSFISALIIIHAAAEMTVSFIIEKWFIHRLNLTLITTSVHIILILCAILYPCLKLDSTTTTHVSLVVLQMFQAIAFQTIWLSGADQVNLIMWSQYDRMKHRSKISALYSSIGPAIGALLAGYILQSNTTTTMEDYAFIYKICVALFSFSFVVSWGWTSDN